MKQKKLKKVYVRVRVTLYILSFCCSVGAERAKDNVISRKAIQAVHHCKMFAAVAARDTAYLNAPEPVQPTHTQMKIRRNQTLLRSDILQRVSGRS